MKIIKKSFIIILLALMLIITFNSYTYAATRYWEDTEHGLIYMYGDHKLVCEEQKNKIKFNYTRVSLGQGDYRYDIPEKQVEQAKIYGVQLHFYEANLETWSTKDPRKKSVTEQIEGARDKVTEVDLEKVVDDANAFKNIGSEEQISEERIKNISNTIYNVLMVIGTIIAVIIGLVLAIKFITNGIEGKAEVKQLLLPYGIGVVVLFGAFTIWKVVLTILQN